MKKMKFETEELSQKNIEKIGKLFPNCITEAKDENGKLKKAIDFEMLKQMLSDDVVKAEDETYEFTWVGKKEAMVEANKPIRKTLRPCKEESKDWDNTENLYIEGDNLEVLKLLQESYLNSIKMIYIDPPYNTGNDFIYNDDFKMTNEEYKDESGEVDEEGNRLFKNTDTNGRFHSDWCSMMYSRLMLARNLLSYDGVIFVSMNDDEIDSLIKIMDEVFGGRNHIATLIWDKNHSAQAGIYKTYHEYIVVYANNIENIGTPKSLTSELFEAGAMKKASGRHPLSSFKFPKGTRIEAEDGTEFKGTWGGVEKITLESGRMVVKDKKLMEDIVLTAAFTQRDQMQQYFYGDKERLVDSRGQRVVEFYFNASGKIKVVKERSVETPQTTCRFGTQGSASIKLAKLFELEDSPFNAPKPLNMIKDFIGRFTDDGDIILDFFAGSSTTAEAIFDYTKEKHEKRNFILVQIQEDLDTALLHASKDGKKTVETAISYLDKNGKPHLLTEIGKERIRRAGEKIKIDNANKEGIEDLDTGFRVLKLDETNMKEVYYAPDEYSQANLFDFEFNIKEDRTELDLLFGCLLEWGLPLNRPYESQDIEGSTVHIYNDGDLIACFDNNISEEVIKKIARMEPLRVVFRDSSFETSSSKINVKEIFKLISPETSVRVI
ncbi:site-specific DNA-methyltransferase [Clostridium perfringens]|nr:site-specific DNA-methyltransferase [Clostridium perfringens]